MKAIWNGTVIADSDDTVIVEGNHYFPPESVRWELLTPTGTRTRCPWKGEASYFSVDDGVCQGGDVAWSYKDPSAAADHIAGRVAFWRGVKVIEE